MCHLTCQSRLPFQVQARLSACIAQLSPYVSHLLHSPARVSSPVSLTCNFRSGPDCLPAPPSSCLRGFHLSHLSFQVQARLSACIAHRVSASPVSPVISGPGQTVRLHSPSCLRFTCLTCHFRSRPDCPLGIAQLVSLHLSVSPVINFQVQARSSAWHSPALALPVSPVA